MVLTGMALLGAATVELPASEATPMQANSYAIFAMLQLFSDGNDSYFPAEAGELRRSRSTGWKIHAEPRCHWMFGKKLLSLPPLDAEVEIHQPGYGNG
jgi:hypothetical protein